jgi:hypothetical protein
MAMGGLEAVDLGFSDLYMAVKVKKKKNGDGEKVILDGSIRGRAQSGYVDE